MLLGEITFPKKSFKDLEGIFQKFETSAFLQLGDRLRSNQVNQTLLALIQKERTPCFLLPQVLDFVEKVDQKDILIHYTFNSFELWLNHFSQLSFEENLDIRAKIVGKKVPREEYQRMFPIGMNKVYEGSHFVTAHKSPDLDTTIASFWGWVDAFAAKVGSNLHLWNVPGGPPPSQIEIKLIFQEIFGNAVFTHLAKTRTSLSVTGNDLMTQKDMIRKTLGEKMVSVGKDRDTHAVVIVDQEGYFLGDWRSIDVEGVRQLIMLLNASLRWFENNLHVNIISLFASPTLSLNHIPPFLEKIFTIQIKECEPVRDFSEQDKERLDSFLKKVFYLEKGIASSFSEFAEGLQKLSIIDLKKVQTIFTSIQKAGLFDETGKLKEDRPLIFSYLEKVVKKIHEAIQTVRSFLEQFDIALKIKTQVYGFKPKYVSVRDDVEEMRSKIGPYQHLTVVYPEKNRLFPVGIILAEDLRKKVLGTVSLRDFCNREEMTIPSYLEVISVIDHHKSSLQTYAPPNAIIADAQSSNSIVFELSYAINKRYSARNQTSENIEQQLQKLRSKNDLVSLRLQQKLLLNKLCLEKKQDTYVHPEREMVEYLHFLYGILDDTDLLSKVSSRDVEAVCLILNSLKSLVLQEEVEIVQLDDLPRDKDFPKKAAKRILQNEDMYSLYKKVYQFREEEISKNIQLCAEKKPNALFTDTKEQNGCCRVGQTKMFANNVSLFEKNLSILRATWLQNAVDLHQDKPEYDLHLHMLSTIVGAQEVYQGKEGNYLHKDQLWIWAAPTETGAEHLKRFLNAFQESPQLKDNDLEVEFCGENTESLAQIFQESFVNIPVKKAMAKMPYPMAVLHYKAGSLNSRKAMISPYLPSLVF